MVHAFPKGINPKVIMIMRQVFEFAYFEAAVQPLRSSDECENMKLRLTGM